MLCHRLLSLGGVEISMIKFVFPLFFLFTEPNVMVGQVKVGVVISQTPSISIMIIYDA